MWSSNTGAGFTNLVKDKNDEQPTAKVEIHISLETFQHSQDFSNPERQIRSYGGVNHSLLQQIGLCLFNKRIYDSCIQDPKIPNPIWDNSGICELITNFKSLHKQQSILYQTLDIAAQQDAWANILAHSFADCLYQRSRGYSDKTKAMSTMRRIIDLMFEDTQSMTPIGIEFGSYPYVTYPCIPRIHGGETHTQITLPAYFLPPADQVMNYHVGRSSCWPQTDVVSKWREISPG